jgi:FKBP-type peptidyl-prolyl cis-trans isomerase
MDGKSAFRLLSRWTFFAIRVNGTALKRNEFLMRIGLTRITVTFFALCLAAPAIRAADTPSPFKDDKEKASYGVGLYFGNQIKNGNLDLDLDVVNQAMKDILEGREPKLNQQQAHEAIMSYQHAQQLKVAEKNRKAGDAFLAENKAKSGVQTHTVTLPNGTTADLQYKVITKGTGSIPSSNDVVNVNYRGTLIDGKEFDSSAKHGGKPARFPVRGVVPGWTAALEMMPVGSKWELYLPSTLAYGDAGQRGIEPGSTLIFEVELVSIEPPAPPPAAPAASHEPLTSDIIKVPSAEELKKGAKIEVIKAEDVEKLTKQQTNSPAAK